MKRWFRLVLPALTLMTAASILGVLPASAAQTAAKGEVYPSRPVHLVVPYAAGAGGDILARLVGQKLSELWGQPVVVDNRTGAAGNIGFEYGARAQPNGYTLLLAFNNLVTNAAFYPKLPFDVVKDFAPITVLVVVPMALVITPNLGVNSVREFVKLVRSRPGKINFGSPGTGTLPHLLGEQFKTAAGVDMVHVPYKGIGPAINAQLAGEIQANFPTLFSAAPFFQSGRLRALAVTSLKRSSYLPDIPTMDESGLKGFDVIAWYGVLAPGATPPALVAKIQRDIARVIAMPDLRNRLVADGSEPAANEPEVFSRQIRAEVGKWKKLVKQLGLKPDGH